MEWMHYEKEKEEEEKEEGNSQEWHEGLTTWTLRLSCKDPNPS